MNVQNTTTIYDISSTPKLIDINKNMTKFECQFRVMSESPFYLTIVNQKSIDDGDDFVYRNPEKTTTGTVKYEKNVLLPHYMVLKSDAPTKVTVQLKIHPIEDPLKLTDFHKKETVTSPHPPHSPHSPTAPLKHTPISQIEEEPAAPPAVVHPQQPPRQRHHVQSHASDFVEQPPIRACTASQNMPQPYRDGNQGSLFLALGLLALLIGGGLIYYVKTHHNITPVQLGLMDRLKAFPLKLK